MSAVILHLIAAILFLTAALFAISLGQAFENGDDKRSGHLAVATLVFMALGVTLQVIA
ncbi:hypothetical protein MACH17_18190 [Phaeobacter inhibens]|uniref:hypothetical protein n=1 Tax=Phaeobacter inhibens TaxID=221822 RepID=UPI002760354D|nr:hypothetical protein [Phaeobacter inhibens]GLO70302.1 hypothetical protein MACH17_18190 [Phaeobacter inhibens]